MLAVVTLEGAQLASVRVVSAETSPSCTSSQKFNNPSECVSKEPNPVLPEMREIVWGLGSFLLLFLLIRLVAYPRLQRGTEARANKIQGDLDAAERARDSVGAEREAYERRLAAARAEAQARIDAARAEVETLRAQKLGALNEELGKIRSAAAEELAQARAGALASMRGTVTDLAVSAAERVVARPIDRNAQLAVVEDYVNNAGRN